MKYALQFETSVSVKHYFRSPREVYDFLSEFYSHEICANAEGWCELASVGEEYEDSKGKFDVGFTILVEE